MCICDAGNALSKMRELEDAEETSHQSSVLREKGITSVARAYKKILADSMHSAILAATDAPARAHPGSESDPGFWDPAAVSSLNVLAAGLQQADFTPAAREAAQCGQKPRRRKDDAWRKLVLPHPVRTALAHGIPPRHAARVVRPVRGTAFHSAFYRKKVALQL